MKASYHLPGLFEFYEFYKVFLPLYRNKREYFYDFVEISSIYGAPSDCIWQAGRTSFGEADYKDVYGLMKEYDISSRFTFSNSLLNDEHLSDKRCNDLCRLYNDKQNGIIIYSDKLLDYIRRNYPDFYFVSTTTKVLTDFKDFLNEINRDEFKYVVADFRLNKAFDRLKSLNENQKNKVEFLVNECCYIGCKNRKQCYENVSRKCLGLECEDFICREPLGNEGYKFSLAKTNPSFISIEDIQNVYIPMGFSNFKIEGRGLGSAMLLEFILYYMVKPEYQLNVREEIYLDSMLDLF